MPAMSDPLIAATRNPDKMRAIAALVAPWPLEAQPDDLAAHELVITGGRPSEALRTIAASKALQVAQREPGRIIVATDGGLHIPALAGWEPALTRRFAGDATNSQRARTLLARAAALRGEQRRIIWMEAVAVASADGVRMTAVATSLPGLLGDDLADEQKRGDTLGFWLSMVWRPDPGRDAPSSGTEHWTRLRPIVRAYLDGAMRRRP